MERVEHLLGGNVAAVFRALPGMTAALGALPSAKPVVLDDLARNEVATRISEADMTHMSAFPADDKAHLMYQVMSHTPLTNEPCTESHHYEKTMMRLHSEGYQLIDMQSLETALTTVWYRKSRAPWSTRADVKMVLWESQPSGETTTVMTWRI